MGQTGLALAALSAQERGFLLGTSLLGLGEAALARLAPVEAASSGWQTLRALPRSERAAVLAGWLLEMKRPFPDGVERLHPSWIARVIASEPEALWPALLSGVPGAGAVAALLPWHGDPVGKAAEAGSGELVCEIQRCVFLPLAPLAVPPAGPVGASLCRLGCAELLQEATRRGAVASEPAPGMRSDRDPPNARGLAALYREVHAEGNASVWAVAGRLPAELGETWLDPRRVELPASRAAEQG